MESRNYTYEEEHGYCQDIGEWIEYKIIDRDGEVIARAVCLNSAELIVAALNGVAP